MRALLTIPLFVLVAAPAWAAAPMPKQVTLGDLPAPPDYDEIGELREERRHPGKAAVRKRDAEMKSLVGRIRATPTDPAMAKWLHRLAELETHAAWHRMLENNKGREAALKRAAKERKKLDRKRKRYEYKLALSIRRKWKLPAKPDLTPTVTVPPKSKIDLRQAIRHYETIITNHPQYRRMDQVLLHAGTLRIHQAEQDNNLPGLAAGEQYLNQVLFEFGWSPLAPRARVRLADLALVRGQLSKARDFLEDLERNEVKPELRDYAKYRLAWMKAPTALKEAVAALNALAVATPDAVLKRLAKRDAQRLAELLPPAPEADAGAAEAKGGKPKKRKRGKRRRKR